MVSQLPALDEFAPLLATEPFLVVVVVVAGRVVTVTAGARSEYLLEPLGYQSGKRLRVVVVLDCSATEELVVEVVAMLD